MLWWHIKEKIESGNRDKTSQFGNSSWPKWCVSLKKPASRAWMKLGENGKNIIHPLKIFSKLYCAQGVYEQQWLSEPSCPPGQTATCSALLPLHLGLRLQEWGGWGEPGVGHRVLSLCAVWPNLTNAWSGSSHLAASWSAPERGFLLCVQWNWKRCFSI